MPFRQKRGDTTVGTIETTYGVILNVRRDMKLKNLLLQRGFTSQTQLLNAYYGRANSLAKRRKIFPSFHGEDINQIQGFRLMVANPNIDLDLNEKALLTLVNSQKDAYIKRELSLKIKSCEVLICLIGNGTAWRDMVDWEIQKAVSYGKGICAVRLKGSRGRTPPALVDLGISVATWDTANIISSIEQAAARRS